MVSGSALQTNMGEKKENTQQNTIETSSLQNISENYLQAPPGAAHESCFASGVQNLSEIA